MRFTIQAMNTHPSAERLGFFEARLRYTGPWRNALAIGLTNLVSNPAQYGVLLRLKLRSLKVAKKAGIKARRDRQ